ncbi:IS5 family transposase [Streptomyces sp. NBC_00353]
MSECKRYPSDLTDERWALIQPVITAWKAAHPSVSGHQGRYKMREIVNAILYQSRTGCQWEYLPHDLPPRSAKYYYFAKWREDGTDQTIHDLLRWQVREKAGRSEDPSLVVSDTQSVHAAVNVPAATTGKDAAKKVPGRKRGLAVDVLGLVIAVAALEASVHDNRAGVVLLDRVAARNASVSKVLVDQGFKSTVVARRASGERANEAQVHSDPLPRTGRPRRARPLLRADDHQLQGERLPEWMEAVRADDLPSLHTFTNGLARDLAAVTAGRTLPWSSGVVEGHVSRIKMIKRQMYGRAGFKLLRKRVLLAS